MNPISPILPGSKPYEFTLAKDQTKIYIPLPALYFEDPVGRFITRWQFTPEEREAIAAGADLLFSQLTFGAKFHPVCFQIEPAIQEEDDVPSIPQAEPAEEATTSGEDLPERQGSVQPEDEGGPGRVSAAEASDVGEAREEV